MRISCVLIERRPQIRIRAVGGPAQTLVGGTAHLRRCAQIEPNPIEQRRMILDVPRAKVSMRSCTGGIECRKRQPRGVATVADGRPVESVETGCGGQQQGHGVRGPYRHALVRRLHRSGFHERPQAYRKPHPLALCRFGINHRAVAVEFVSVFRFDVGRSTSTQRGLVLAWCFEHVLELARQADVEIDGALVRGCKPDDDDIVRFADNVSR